MQQQFTYEQYSKPGFIESIFDRGLDRGYCDLQVADGHINVPVRMALLNIIFWVPLMQNGMIPSSKEFLKFKAITAGSISDIQSRYYFLILVSLNKNGVDMAKLKHMKIVREFAANVNWFYNLICRYMNAYMPFMDALGLARLCENPPIKKLIETKIDDKVGTQVAEKMIRAQTNELVGYLSKPGLDSNILLPYMAAKTLKKNQIPHEILKYGPRSDVDDSMCRHIINESSFSGIKTAADFGIESLSAKKCAFLNKTVLKKSQYFNRKTRLAGTLLPNLYIGSCGSTMTIPFYIKPEFAKNMYYRSIEEDGKIVQLNKDNITQYVGKTVHLFSIFGCKHTDGFCERCAGFRYYPEHNIGLHHFLPEDIHVGLLSVSQLMSRVTQKILSNKHLIDTNSKTYTLPENTSAYMNISGDNAIFWNPGMSKKMKGYSLRIPSDSMGHISDLILDVLPAAETYSKIPYVDIMKDDTIVDTIYMKEDKGESFVPYLSEDMLEYMRDQYSNIEYRDNGYVVPMSDFNMKKPFMNFVVMNDDLISYVNRFKTFISKDIMNYNSVSRCLSDFADVVYHKSELNLFYLEVILRALNSVSPTDYHIPVITDPDNTSFIRLDEKVTEAAISLKLAQEQVYKYLQNPRSMLYEKPCGLFGPFFGLV